MRVTHFWEARLVHVQIQWGLFSNKVTEHGSHGSLVQKTKFDYQKLITKNAPMFQPISVQ